MTSTRHAKLLVLKPMRNKQDMTLKWHAKKGRKTCPQIEEASRRVFEKARKTEDFPSNRGNMQACLQKGMQNGRLALKSRKQANVSSKRHAKQGDLPSNQGSKQMHKSTGRERHHRAAKKMPLVSRVIPGDSRSALGIEKRRTWTKLACMSNE